MNHLAIFFFQSCKQIFHRKHLEINIQIKRVQMRYTILFSSSFFVALSFVWSMLKLMHIWENKWNTSFIIYHLRFVHTIWQHLKMSRRKPNIKNIEEKFRFWTGFFWFCILSFINFQWHFERFCAHSNEQFSLSMLAS